MLRLTFNTTQKLATLTTENGTILAEYFDIPTVKVREGYYEIMQKFSSDLGDVQIPVCRTPISNTLMFLNK